MSASSVTTSTTGASLAWTSDDSLMVAWRDLISQGEFASANGLIVNVDSPEAIEARALLHRLRYDWSLDRAAMLAKLRSDIPDVTETDLDAWTSTGKLESMMIDGERRYFRREPRNLFLFNRDARERRAKAKGQPLPPDRHDELSPIIPTLVEVVAASEKAPGEREVMPIRTRFEYTLIVKPDRPGAARGSTVRAWLPFPQVYGQQREVKLIDSFPRTEYISPRESKQRTIHFQQKIRDPSKPVRFEVSFEYTTAATCAILNRGMGLRHVKNHVPEAPATEDVRERPPHIVFTDEVRAIVQDQSKVAPDKPTLAKRLWEWVESNIPWRAEHEYCLIPSITEQALRLRKGDCGTVSLVYISLCRCAGIPARWQSGWTTDPATGGNMHDWTEINLDDLGWIPVDPSYGKKSHPDPRVRDFYFGNLDPYRLIVNTDFGQQLSPPMSGLRAEPLDFQRGEVEIDGRVLYFDEWDYEFRFSHSDCRE
jgi:transglutaminase-like putative cysteine protease